VKLTNQQIINSKALLTKLGSQKMEAVLAYKIQRNINKLNPELVQLEKAAKDIIEKYNSETNEEIKKGYLKELEDLSKIEVEIDIFQVKIEDLVFDDISPFELMTIDWMLL
jgi:hypothetical protein